jgi:LAGLIDADG-like domain
MRTKCASKQLENEIILLSETKSQKEIAIIYGRTQSGINVILKRNNINKLKKSRLNMSRLALNIDYFKEINSNDKAYWLGFICADGNINKTNNKVSLTSKDLEVIEGFKEAICSEHKISKRETFDKRTSKTYTGYSIQIGNEIFTQNLINLGVTSNKTNVLEFPKIEEKYYSYFIAGLFDGDGSISWAGKNKNYLKINLISTKEILNFIGQYILKIFDIKPIYCSRVTENKSNVWKMYLYSDAHKFLEFIYVDKEFKYYLKRKYNIYLNNTEKRKNIRHFRKIYQYDKNMNLIKIWNSQKEIGDDDNFNERALNTYLRKGNIRGFYKNYIWKYDN